jgi:uncharacterized UPF0160 family protein
VSCSHDWQIYSARCVKCGVNADEACRLIQQELQIPFDKIILHKDRITEYQTRIAELKRQADELYPIMKFEQERANRAVEVLKRVYQFKHRLPQELEYEITKLLKEAQS